SPTGALIKGKAGAGMLALKSGAPVLPVALTGSERLPFNGSKGRAQKSSRRSDKRQRRVRIVYGEPFIVPRIFNGEKIGADEATEIIMLEIARLLPEEYRGVYADLLRKQTVRKIVPYVFSESSSTSASPSTSSSERP
ncbi:MAG: lysophospholipid acyltransferase family protein, partial [Thermomicrobiales bacterium]